MRNREKDTEQAKENNKRKIGKRGKQGGNIEVGKREQGEWKENGIGGSKKEK